MAEELVPAAAVVMAVSIAKIEIATADTNDRVKAIEKVVIVGNGQPSLISRVATLEADKSTTRWMLGIGIAAGTLFTSVLALVLRFADLPTPAK